MEPELVNQVRNVIVQRTEVFAARRHSPTTAEVRKSKTKKET
jgi:hypothetical protein